MATSSPPRASSSRLRISTSERTRTWKSSGRTSGRVSDLRRAAARTSSSCRTTSWWTTSRAPTRATSAGTPRAISSRTCSRSRSPRCCVEYGAMQVETPIMYDFEHPALAKYLDKFPARQYVVRSEKSEYFLRFAACFGQYLIKHDMSISYRNLPVRLYELTHYQLPARAVRRAAGSETPADLHHARHAHPVWRRGAGQRRRCSTRWISAISG